MRRVLKLFSQGVVGKSENCPESRKACGYEFQPHDKQTTKLHRACWFGQIENASKFLKKVNVNVMDGLRRTPLHLAVARNFPDIVRLLLEHGAKRDVTDDDGFTPFLKAVEIGNVEVVKMFLKCGENLKTADLYGNTALHLSALNGHNELTSLLLKCPVQMDLRNMDGDSPLHIATRNENVNLAALLLKMGAGVDVIDCQGRTSAMLAVKLGNVPLTKLFFKNGASRAVKDLSGKTISDYVSICGCRVIKEMFFDRSELAKSKCEDDSQISDLSYIIPPSLDPPKSLDFLDRLQKSRSLEEFLSGSGDDDDANPPSCKSLYRRSSPVRRPPRRKDLAKCKSLTFCKDDEGDRDVPQRPLGKYEEYAKALRELSLDVAAASIDRMKSNDGKVADDDNDRNVKTREKRKVTADGKIAENDVKMADTRGEKVTNTDEKVVGIDKRRPEGRDDGGERERGRISSVNAEDSWSSSDEDPPFWRPAGEFSPRPNPAIKKNFQNEIDPKFATLSLSASRDSSSSNSECESSQKKSKIEVPENVLLRDLKASGKENDDLSEEAAVLRECVEKLKYELADARDNLTDKTDGMEALRRELMETNRMLTETTERADTAERECSSLRMELKFVGGIYEEVILKNESLSKRISSMEDKLRQVEDLRVSPDKFYEYYIERKEDDDETSKRKFIEGRSSEPLFESVEMKLKECKNANKKFLLEISRLASRLKQKELEENRLKEELERFREAEEKAGDEKRRILLEKSFNVHR